MPAGHDGCGRRAGALPEVRVPLSPDPTAPGLPRHMYNNTALRTGNSYQVIGAHLNGVQLKGPAEANGFNVDTSLIPLLRRPRHTARRRRPGLPLPQGRGLPADRDAGATRAAHRLRGRRLRDLRLWRRRGRAAADDGVGHFGAVGDESGNVCRTTTMRATTTTHPARRTSRTTWAAPDRARGAATRPCRRVRRRRRIGAGPVAVRCLRAAGHGPGAAGRLPGQLPARQRLALGLPASTPSEWNVIIEYRPYRENCAYQSNHHASSEHRSTTDRRSL